MKYARVTGHIRYVAFLSPVARHWYVKRETLLDGQWETSPSVVWHCLSEHSAGQTADKQAALERHLLRERANAE